MKYKNYCFNFLFLIFINLIIIYPTLFYYQLGVPVEDTRYLAEWIALKNEYANEITERKILIISGSNTLFGISAQEIEKECNIPTVNMGSHAGLGLKYILDNARPYIRDGDIVLLPLEYVHYEEIQSFQGEYLSYVMARDVPYFQKMKLTEKIRFIFSVSPDRIVQGIKEKYLPAKKRIGEYDSIYLNKNGDMENNKNNKKLEDNALKAQIKGTLFKNNILPSDDSQKCLLDFLKYCNDRKVMVFVTYPAYLYSDKNFKGNDLVALNNINKFWEKNNVTVLGTYNQFLYDSGDFYDTVYHLNNEGRKKRTKTIINYLKKYIN